MTTWTESAMDRLIDLWAKGWSCSVIATQLRDEGLGSFTRNAVIGKAHRLGLESRPSPIKNLGKGSGKHQRRRADRAEIHTVVKPLFADMPAPAAPKEPDHYSSSTKDISAGFNASGPVIDCQWPEGHPGEPGFHFCGERSRPGKPYCAEHCAVAYMKIKHTEAA